MASLRASSTASRPLCVILHDDTSTAVDTILGSTNQTTTTFRSSLLGGLTDDSIAKTAASMKWVKVYPLS